MKRQTRIGEVRSIAKAFLYIDIAPTRLSYIASHPFTNTWDTALPREELASFTEDGKDNEGEVIVNLYGEKFEIRREAV